MIILQHCVKMQQKLHKILSNQSYCLISIEFSFKQIRSGIMYQGVHAKHITRKTITNPYIMLAFIVSLLLFTTIGLGELMMTTLILRGVSFVVR